MNKKFWVTVDVNNADVSRDELVGMLQEAEAIIAKK